MAAHGGGVSRLSHKRGARSVLGILAAHNIVQNFLLNERGYVTGNLAVSALLVGIGRQSGVSWDEIGLGRQQARQSLAFGAGAAATAAAAAGALAMSHPRGRDILRDERAAEAGRENVWKRALVRFPLGTALFEEVAFRGVLPALLLRGRGTWRADLLSAGVFAAWHVIPTARALAGNAMGADQSSRQRTTTVIAGSAAAGVAGLGFSWLRRRTGGLLAPWLVHAVLNTISFVAAVIAQRRSDET